MEGGWLLQYYSAQAKGLAFDCGQYGGSSRAGGTFLTDYHVAPKFQRGYGLGGVLTSIFRRVFPFLAANALPIIKSTAKDAGRNLIKAGLATASDAISGANIKESAKTNFKRAGKNIASKAVESIKAQVGGAQKRKLRQSTSNRRKVPRLQGVRADLYPNRARPGYVTLIKARRSVPGKRKAKGKKKL